MRGTGPLVALAAFWLPAAALAQEHAAPTPAELQGPWKLVSLSYDGKPQTASGYMVFAGDRYSFVTTRERPPLTREVNAKTVDQLTSEEKDLYVQAYRSMTAAAGPYTIEKGEILFMREVVRSPHLAGTAEHRRSWLEGQGNRLVQDFQGGGRRQVYVWERAAGGSAAPPAAAEPPDLRGVWRSVSYVRDGRKLDLEAMMVITARHISRMSMERNRPSFAAFDFRQVDKLTPDQERAIARAYPMFNGTAGTWRIDGDTFYFRSAVHHNPDAVGRESDRKFELKGDRLRLYGPAGSGMLEELWERIEAVK